jgi:hypothetical protein
MPSLQEEIDRKEKNKVDKKTLEDKGWARATISEPEPPLPPAPIVEKVKRIRKKKLKKVEPEVVEEVEYEDEEFIDAGE